MNRRILGVLAMLLALAGAGALIAYASGADARAIAGLTPTNVLVVKKDVPVGTLAKDIAPFVEVRQLPQASVVKGSVSDVAQLPAGTVASTGLKVGEQVLAGRFVQPNSDDLSAQVALPAGMQELSLQLEPQRVLGSRLKAGDTVGVFVSLKVEGTDANKAPVSETHLISSKVLVMRAQGATSAAAGAPGTEKAPSDDVVITLAVDAATAERIVFGQEFGKVYLSLQKSDSTIDGTKIVTAGNVYGP